MDEELKQEYNDSIEEQFGYRPSDLVWCFATHIAHQHIRKALLQKLSKDISPAENMIEREYKMILQNIEIDFMHERAKKYGTRN